jgi:hypothetical protein
MSDAFSVVREDIEAITAAEGSGAIVYLQMLVILIGDSDSTKFTVLCINNKHPRKISAVSSEVSRSGSHKRRRDQLNHAVIDISADIKL